jgi:hypothetical protein
MLSRWMSRVNKKTPTSLAATSETTLKTASTNQIRIPLTLDIKSWLVRKGGVPEGKSAGELVPKHTVDTNLIKNLQLEYSSSIEEEALAPTIGVESLHLAPTRSMSSIDSSRKGRRAGIYIPSSVILGRDPKTVEVDSMVAYQVNLRFI